MYKMHSFHSLSVFLLDLLKAARRQRRRQRERQKTIALISKTLALQMRYKLLYIPCPSFANQRREMSLHSKFFGERERVIINFPFSF